jgi:hypothetical protein
LFVSVPGCQSGQLEQTVNLPAYAFGGSNPSPGTTLASIAQSVERVLGKDEVTGSNPVGGSMQTSGYYAEKFFPISIRGSNDGQSEI